MTTSRRPARGFSTWRTGLASISPIFAAQLNARWTAVIAPRLPRPQPGWASTHCWTWNGFSSLDRQVAGDRAGEGLEVVAVPVVGPRGAVLLAPVEERVEDRDHGVAGRPVAAGRGRRHQVVIAAERLVAVGAEVDLAAVELDVPEPARARKNGLG